MNALALGFLTLAPAPMPDATLYQFSVLETLNLANYDGALEVKRLLRRGDFGLGTYNGLNGEMIVLDGKAYQADETGTLHVMASGDRTPFAVVTRFRSAAKISLPEPRTLAELQAEIAKKLVAGTPYAIRVTGQFDVLKARSFPKQTPPYRPLPELVPGQKTFEWRDRRATLVGFFMPTYLARTNAPGFHFHTVTEDRRNGGHAMDAQIRNAVVDLMPIGKVEVEIPAGGIPGSGR
ncbi:MAG: acetolactate decarboxylase [Fimbriimonas sp.]